MSEATNRLISEIRKRIRQVSRRVTLGRLLYGVTLFAGLLCAGIFVAVAVEAAFWLATMPRTVMFWLLVGSTTVGAAVLVFPPLAHLVGLRPGPDDETVARMVGRRFPEVSDRLLDLLQLASGRRSQSTDPLVDGAVAQLGEAVASVNYSEVEQFEDFRRVGRMARWPIIGLVAFVLMSPGTFGSAAKRMLSPGTVFLRPDPFKILVEPGDARLVKGDSLSIVARMEGSRLPSTATLSITRDGERRTESVLLQARDQETFVHTIPNVRDGFKYSVEAGPVESATYRVAVSSRPFVRQIQVTVTPPPYTGLSIQRLAPDVGDVTAVKGSKVDLSLDLAGDGLSRGEVVFDVLPAVPLLMRDLIAEAGFSVVQDDRYRIAVTSQSGIANENPIEYRVRAIQDHRPSIFVLEPALSSEFDDDLKVEVSARITDDFGFSGLSLFYRLAESRFGEPQEAFTEVRLSSPAPRELDQQIDFVWNTPDTGLDLVPGDVVTFYLEVRDNDAVSGYKSAASDLHTVHFPSLTDQFEAIDDQQDDVERALEDLMQESDALRDSFRELRDDLRREQEGDWEDQRTIERLKERQSQLQQKVGDLTDKMESMVDEMNRNNLLSPETLERFAELKRVIEEINSPELQEALEKLQQALSELDLTEMQRSLGSFEFNEDQFKDRIERALELFKRLRTEQQLEEAERRAEDLSNREAKLAEQTERLSNDAEKASTEEESDSAGDESERPDSTAAADLKQDSAVPDADQLAAEQERAAEDMSRLEELMERINEQMEELSPSSSDQMERLRDQVGQENLKGQMRQNANQMRSGELQRAQEQQQQMQNSLQQLSESLSQMKQQMSGAQMKANLAALRRALDDVLTLSLEQEQLRDDVRSLASREAGLREYTEQQAELRTGLEVVGDTLSRLSRSIPEMSRQIQTHAGAASIEMQRAVDEMTERRGQQAIGHQKGAMTDLNDLALLLSDLMQNIQSQQSGLAGMSMQQMMQQLQQMAGDQSQLNEQIQQFLNDMQGTRLGQDMQARLRQMAAQQEALKKQLEEMSEQGPDAAGKLLGDLDEIARQMEETISEMRARKVDRKLYERQQEILTRLLDAQRSMHERGKENRRESRTGEDLERASPSELTPNERAERLRRELLKALEAGYTPDYEELIRRYFEALRQEEDNK